MDCKLYYKPTCPYCQKVLTFMREHEIDLELIDITEGDNEAKLIEFGGKKQVPCLDCEGRPLYESDDIISYMNEKMVKNLNWAKSVEEKQEIKAEQE